MIQDFKKNITNLINRERKERLNILRRKMKKYDDLKQINK